MLSPFQIQQLTAIQSLPNFVKFCNPLPTVADWIADSVNEPTGVITVLFYNTLDQLTAQRIGTRRILQTVTV